MYKVNCLITLGMYKYVQQTKKALGTSFQIASYPMLTTPEAIERFAPLERGCYVEGILFYYTWYEQLCVVHQTKKALGTKFQIAFYPMLMSTTREAIEQFAPLERGCYVEGKCFQFTWK